MRIGLDVTPLAVPRTGIGTVVSHLAAGLASNPNFSLAPFALTGRGAGRVRDGLPEGSTLPRPLPASLVHRLWRVLPFPPARLLAGGPVDLVHGTNFYGIPGAPAELITIHDTGPWERPGQVAPAVRHFPGLVGQALKRGAHVHTLSYAAGDEVRSLLGLPEDRVHPIQIGFDLPPTDVVRPPGLPMHDGQFVLAVGSIEPRKRMPELVDALSALLGSRRDVRLIIAGDGPDTATLQSRITSHPLIADRVHALGYVSAPEKSWLLQHATVVVSNSLSEGFGMVPLEAMAVGTPTVATDGAVQREVCGEASLLVPVADPGTLADTVASVLDDNGLRARLIAAGSKQQASFTWQRTITEMLALYAKLISD